MNGPRTLSANHLSRLDVALHGHVSQSTHEFQLIFMLHHMINDTLAVYATEQHMCELLGGSATPGGPLRTDAELAKALDHEWMRRWGALRVAHDPIVAATEVRILELSQSKFQEAAWKVDNQNIQKQSIVRSAILSLALASYASPRAATSSRAPKAPPSRCG
jgi:hypothetical protein